MHFINKIDKPLLLSIIIFIILFVPFLGVIPYRDGNIDLIQSHDLYSGGFQKWFENWRTVHPPLKPVIAIIAFRLGGINSLSYTSIGLVLGIVGITSFYQLAKTLFSKKMASIAVILFAVSPMFIATGIFALSDYILTILVVISLLFYSKKRYFSYGFSSSLLVLTKETGLVLPASIIISELFYVMVGILKQKRLPQFKLLSILSLFASFVAASAWFYFLKLENMQPWSDWNYSTTSEKGAIFTVINNILTGQFLNKYAYQGWQQAFFLNFNWVIWSFSIIGVSYYLIKHHKEIFSKLIECEHRNKTLLSMFVFLLLYSVSVLSFQTYTIPRYALPLVPIGLIAFSFSIYHTVWKVKTLQPIITTLLFLLAFSRLFFSLDPISTKLWKKTNILGQELYALNHTLAGNDGITYNMQYLLISKERTRQILSAVPAFQAVISEDCRWIFADPSNEVKMVEVLNLKNININRPCIDPVY